MGLTVPGVYDIPLADYVADPAPEPSLSSSIAHVMLDESPLHAWHKHPRLNPQHQSEESSRFDIGTVAHAILLENDRSKIAVVEAADWRTKAAQMCAAEARSIGHIPVLAAQMVDIEKMVRTAQHAIADSELAELFTPTGGKSEQTLLWEENGIWLRSRPDRRLTDWRILVDYKSTGCAEPNAWLRTMLGNGFDVQAALGLRGVERLQLSDRCAFVFIVQEISPPYALSFVGLSPELLSFANAKLNHAMALWRRCIESCNWPGYSSRIAYADLPNWALMQWTDKGILEEMES